MKKNYCLDCGKEISCVSKRCKSCANKEMWQRPGYREKFLGKNNPNYKNGKTLKKNYCIDCDKRISIGAKRCGSCALKGNQNTKGYKWTEKQKVKMKNALHKHHIYLNNNDNEIILLTNSKHRQFHERAYDYILDKYGKEGIDKYLKWFDKEYGLKEKVKR